MLTGFEKFVFTDGTVDNNDGNPLVDDLFYYSQLSRRLERARRCRRALSTRPAGTRAAIRTRSSRPSIYLSANPDVKAAGVDPLDAFRPVRLEGRPRSLAHLRSGGSISPPTRMWRRRMSIRSRISSQFGAQEGRQPFAPSELIAAERLRLCLLPAAQSRCRGGARRSVAAFPDHRLEGGAQPERAVRHERLSRDLCRRRGGARQSARPLQMFGWKEGRDPSVDFDTTSISRPIRTSRPRINPLTHFLHFGQMKAARPSRTASGGRSECRLRGKADMSRRVAPSCLWSTRPC